MPKQLLQSEESRAALRRGCDALANALRVTLGPRGRNVVLDKKFGPPAVCSDGVTVAREIELEDPFENMGAQLLKEASTKTNDMVGDGTTTSVVLAQSLLQEGFKRIAAGTNPMSLKLGIDKAVGCLKEELKKVVTSVTTKEQIVAVASLAAHDNEMGNMIADVMERVGKDGVITVEESKGLKYEIEYVEGMQVDRGYISPYFISNQERMEASLEDPVILITDGKISSVSELLPALERILQISRNLVIVAEDIEGESLATLVVNRLRGTFNCLAIKAPGFGDRRKAMLEDMAILTGGNVITAEAGRKLDSLGLEDLGHCRRVVADKDNTTFIEGRGSETAIQDQIKKIKAQIDQAANDWDREKLQERMAKLAGGVAVIKVGAGTEVELKEKKGRVEDALSATRAAVEEGIVPGGGAILIRLSSALDKLGVEGDVAAGVDIVKKALEEPLRLIAANAGVEGSVIVHAVRNNADLNWGYDAEKGEFCNLMESGIIDPAKVVRATLENSASIASMVLTAEALITDLPEPSSAMPGGMGGGMGGGMPGEF